MSRYVNVDGHMTLTGNVDWYYQRDAAEEDAAMIQGVKGIGANLSRTPHHPQGGGKPRLYHTRAWQADSWYGRGKGGWVV